MSQEELAISLSELDNIDWKLVSEKIDGGDGSHYRQLVGFLPRVPTHVSRECRT